MTEQTATPEAELERLNSREKRYEIGQFFTPEPIAEFMADAINEVSPETVLDPGVGGVFCCALSGRAQSDSVAISIQKQCG